MHITTIIGARPQFIKSSVVSEAMHTLNIRETLVHTGQHYDTNMSDAFFDDLAIRKPDFNLGIRASSHGAQTGRMMEAVEKILEDIQPDCVLVYGDTNSTLAGALAATKLNISVAHVEAGLRSFNREMPEEVNRVLTDHVSDKLFAPTQCAVNNLEREGILSHKIELVGDVMFDASLKFSPGRDFQDDTLKKLNLDKSNYILATIHRAENTENEDRLITILNALNEVNKCMPIILPLHPRTRKALDRFAFAMGNLKFKIVEPVGYIDMLTLEQNASLIVTDSGGVQKEAFFFRVPCVTLREETEWIETVKYGWNYIVAPTSRKKIENKIISMLEKPGKNLRDLKELALYGDGNSAMKIAKSLESIR